MANRKRREPSRTAKSTLKPVNLADVKALAELMDAHDLAELEISDAGVRLAKRRAEHVAVSMPNPASPIAAAPNPGGSHASGHQGHEQKPGATIERAADVEPVDEGQQAPECGHCPVEGPALLVVPEKPEGDQAGEHEQGAEFLKDVQSGQVPAARFEQPVPEGAGQ